MGLKREAPDGIRRRAPTLEGQYIIKNFARISAALVFGAIVRGGRLVADPRFWRELRLGPRSWTT